MRRSRVLAALSASSLLLAAGLFVAHATSAHHARSITVAAVRATGSVGGSSRVGTPRVVRSSRAVPLRAPLAPERARSVAVSYAVDAFSAVAGEPTDAWVQLVAGLCDPAWRAHIEDATSAVGLAKTTVRPAVVATFASWAPAHAVGITVVLASHGTRESLYVELRLSDGRYVVEAAQ